MATIAAEQDVVIRAELDTCLVVQGGPGTGKTAVGLHRAAFLLFEHRDVLDREGVLVVGPNPLFLRYIAQVLPSLGEAATRQTTMERLVGGRVRRVDTADAARIKGDPRMADVILRGARQHLRPPAEDVVIATPVGPAAPPRGCDPGCRRRDPRARHRRSRSDAPPCAPVSGARRGWRTRRRGATTPLRPTSGRRRCAPTPISTPPSPASGRRSQQAVLVKRLLTNARALASAADGVLDPADQARLVRRGAARLDDEPWTAAELVLVDEAEAVLNGVSRTYGHVVVDEAQDLSAMELRAVARRCPSRSMTVLGDLAQATAPGAQSSWEEAVAHLGSPANASIEELELGYRVPKPILDVANRLLPTYAPGVRALALRPPRRRRPRPRSRCRSPTWPSASPRWCGIGPPPGARSASWYRKRS